MGTRSWASLLTYGAFISWQYKNRIAEKKPYHTLLALEEPEAHLHPHAQRSLYRQLTEMKGQKIISTHSPFIASQCNLDELRHFKKQGSFTEVRSLDIDELENEEPRKIRREVLNTRGELLFAKVVVLFEGETEEQAFPIFAEKYWNKHPYELGVSFISVGGQNYKPFLILLKSFNIRCFIFSDGEEKTIKAVNKQIEACYFDKAEIFKLENIMFIPDNKNFEDFLVDSGYSEEILNAIKEIEGEDFIADYIETNHGLSKGRQKTKKPKCKTCNQEIYEDIPRDYKNTDGEKRAILDIISKSKTKYAKAIADNISEKNIPPLISNFFYIIDASMKEKGSKV